MNRDIIKEASRGSKLTQDHKRFSLSVIDYYHLYENYKKVFSMIPEIDETMDIAISEAGYRAIILAYNAGLSVGYRNGKKATKKKMAQTSENN